MTPLRQRMLEDMGIRNLSRNTQLSYLQQVGLYARHFARSPEQLGPEEVRAYQVHLMEVRKLNPSSVSASLVVATITTSTSGRASAASAVSATAPGCRPARAAARAGWPRRQSPRASG